MEHISHPVQAETNAVHRAGLGSNKDSQRKVGGESKKTEMHHISSLSRKSGNVRKKTRTKKQAG